MPTFRGEGHDRSEGEWLSRVTETRALGWRKMQFNELAVAVIVLMTISLTARVMEGRI